MLASLKISKSNIMFTSNTLQLQINICNFDLAGGLGFVLDVFCITLSFLASQSLMVLNCWHCQVLIYFFYWWWIKNIRNISKWNMYSFLKAFLVLMKLLSLPSFMLQKYIFLLSKSRCCFPDVLWQCMTCYI